MHEHGSLPRARRDGLLEERLGDELLLYDQDSHTAHCLSSVAACVWRHCDGERDVAELAQLAGASKNLVADALHELREKQLLDVDPGLAQSTVPGESRREAIGRVARYGAAAAGTSMIVSAAAATPAMASSGTSYSAAEEATEGTIQKWKITSTPEGAVIHTVTPEPGPNKLAGTNCVGKTTPCITAFEVPPAITKVKVT